MQVAILSIYDYANAGYQINKAIHTIANIQAKTITMNQNNIFGYDRDIILNPSNRGIVLNYIKNSDIIHIKGDEPIHAFDRLFSRTLGLKSILDYNKPIVLSVEGSRFRRLNKKYTYALAKWPLSDYLHPSYMLRTTLTPDLNYPEYEGIYIPQAIDSLNKPNIWKNTDIINIVHSPSNRDKKGTNIIIDALNKIQKERKNIKIILIENVTHSECIELKKAATLYIDQILAGWYGYAAMECGQYGIPFMAYLSPLSLKNVDNKFLSSINLGQNFKDIYKAINRALESNLQKLSKDTKKYIDTTHSYRQVGNKWLDIYRQAISAFQKR